MRGSLLAVGAISVTLLFGYIYYTTEDRKPTLQYLPMLPANQSNLTNIINFKYIVQNSKTCERFGNRKFIVIVHSSVKNFYKRNIIRQTWANRKVLNKFNFTIRFVTGKSENISHNLRVIDEASIYGDLIVQDYKDSYYNLTLKAISWMRWVKSHCVDENRPEIIVKVDDDIAIHIFNLYKYLNFLSDQNKDMKREKIFCELRAKDPVMRSKGKWKISVKEYGPKYYPDFCPGKAIIFDRKLVNKLSDATYHVPFYKLDDVYMTAFLRTYVNASIDNIKNRFGNIRAANIIFELINHDKARIDRWTQISKNKVF